MNPQRALCAAASSLALALALASSVRSADGVAVIAAHDPSTHAVWLVRLAVSGGWGADAASRAVEEAAEPSAWRMHSDLGRTAAAPLAPLVAGLAADGHVSATELLPAAGVLAVTGDDVARDRLARADGVLDVRANRQHRLPVERATFPTIDPRAGHLERVNAPGAWQLGATGAGATVAFMDSGVDWRHPALAGGYRGRDGRHDYAWADLAGSTRGSREPFDPNGHGTHVAGLAVGHGAGGAWGVAPGADWLAVRVFDGQGETSDLTLLRGAEWLLAPTDRDGHAPRPDLAPDVVNASWNLENTADPLFEPILAAWRAAGIVAVFAAGNDEDGSGSYATVRAPGSSSLALSVGALGARDAIWLLSRGGPTWDGRLKPDLVAPGVGLVSSMSGGGFVSRTGTSMATPLVAGAAALVRGAAPWLGPGDVGQALMSASDDLGPVGPDPVFGHGALNAGAAVALALESGRLGGRVVALSGEPIVGAIVRAAREGEEEQAASVEGGAYRLLLRAGAWDLSFEAAGFQAATRAITVPAGAFTVADARLTVPSGGRVAGRLSSRDGTPLVGTVAATRPAPVGLVASPGVTTDPDGRFSLLLPEGRHMVRFRAPGHQAVTRTVDVVVGRVTARDVTLRRAPSILIVDGDAWQAERTWPYVGRALADAGHAYDVWTLDDPGSRAPSLADLAPYGVVWWAHLFGSPGQLDHRRGDQAVTEALAGYVAGGGRLLLSGQDIGAWDAQDGFVTGRFAPAFFRDVLGARLVGERAPSTWAIGRGPAFEGLRLVLDDPLARAKGPRLAPDAVAAARDGARALMVYADGTAAALGSAGPGGRSAYVAFGPESAGDRTAMARFADAAIGWLEVPEPMLSGPARGAPGEVLSLGLRVLAGRGGGAAAVRLTVPPELDLTLPTGWLSTATGAEWRGELPADDDVAWPIEVRIVPAATGRDLAIVAAVEADAHVAMRTHVLGVVAPDLRASTLRWVPGSPRPGEAMRAELALRNQGPVAATGIARLLMPGPWAPDPSPVVATAGTVAWRSGVAEWRGTIAAGGQVTITTRGRPTGDPGSALVVRAAVTPTIGAALTRVATATLGAPRLVISGPVRLPGAVDAGAAFTASVPVANVGMSSAIGEVRIALPDGMSDGESPERGGVVILPVRVAAGGAMTATARLRVDPRASAGLRTLAVGVALAGEAASPSIVSATILVGAPDLSPSTVRIAPAVPRGGQTLTITLRLVNAGTVAAEVVAIDALPPSLTVLDATVTVTGGAAQRSPGLVEWRVEVSPGEVETLVMQARLGSTLGPNAVVPHAWRITSPSGTRALSDTLLADPVTLAGSTFVRALGSVRPGGRVRYRLVVAADGVVDAREASARIDLPWAMNVVAASPDLVREGARALAWRGRLAPGERRRLEFDALFDLGLAPGMRLPVSARLSATGVAPLTLVGDALVSGPGPTVDLTATRAIPLSGEPVRLVATLRGGSHDQPVDLELRVPEGLWYVPGSAVSSAGAPPVWRADERRLTWSGTLSAGQAMAVAFSATSGLTPGAMVTSTATLDDAAGRRLAQAWVDVRGAAARTWLPLVQR